jgi:hypothetical protein
MNLTSPQQLQLVASFSPFTFNVADTLENGTTISITPTVIGATAGGSAFSYFINLPNSTNNVIITIVGSQTGVSLLWRYVSNIPFLTLSGPNIVTEFPFVYTLVPIHQTIFEAFGISTASQAGGQLSVPSYTLDNANPGYLQYDMPFGVVGSIVVRQSIYLPVSILLIVLAALLVILSGLQAIPSGRKFVGGLYSRVYKSLLSYPVSNIKKIWRKVRTATGSELPLRRRIFSKHKLQAGDLLVYFILCGILMVAVAVMFGPNPSVQAFVVSTDTHDVHQGLDNALGNVQIITPSEDYTDFNVMSSVGQFNVAVISGYPSFSLDQVKGFVLPNLGNVPVIVIDNNTDPTLANEIKDLYPNNVIKVGNAASLTTNETKLIAQLVTHSRVNNALGLDIGTKDFEYVSVIEGGLSFLLIFLGWAYLGARVAEPGGDLTLTRVAYFIAAGVFIFYFSEVIYVSTSAILEFPLSLHAVISGAQSITATGIFGSVLHIPLGGGSTPRLLSGLVGVLFGALIISRGPTFSFKSMGLIIGAAVLLLANPLTLGSFVFQGLLLFVGNIPLGTAYESALTFKGFLYGIGSALGGSVTPVYLMSAGKITYFTGLVPLAFIKKMGKVTATLTLLICAILVGNGGVRVGEMTPTKTVIGVLPGLFAGFVLVFVLLLISEGEKYLASNYSKSVA